MNKVMDLDPTRGRRNTMSALCTLHEAFLLPAHSHIFIAWFLSVPNYTADKFLKRKRIWKEQTSLRDKGNN